MERSNHSLTVNDIVNFGVRFTGSSWQGHVWMAFRRMPASYVMKEIGKLGVEFQGIAGLSFSKHDAAFWLKTNFHHRVNTLAVDKDQVGTCNLGTKRFLDVDNLRSLGLLVYCARHYEALLTGKVENILYLLLEFVPQPPEAYRKLLVNWNLFRGDSKRADFKKRCDFYSTLLSDASVYIFYFIHKNVNILYDTHIGMPQMKHSTSKLLEQDLDMCSCYNGEHKHTYGNYNNEKYVQITDCNLIEP